MRKWGIDMKKNKNLVRVSIVASLLITTSSILGQNVEVMASKPTNYKDMMEYAAEHRPLVILDENGEIPAIFSGAVYIAAYPSCVKRKIRRLQECGMCCKTLRKYLDSTFLSGL